MNNIINGEVGSKYTYIPMGCKLCQQGAKMVLFVTGICKNKCFYCPLSDERKKDISFANEKMVISDQDIIQEALKMDALGTGITGGEPLLNLQKVLHYITLLKSYFGKSHHIHLYTSLPTNENIIRKLSYVGLDEIRYHPPVDLWNTDLQDYINSISIAKKYLIECGFEIPAINGFYKIIEITNKTNCFLNINELEFTENNSNALKNKKYKLKNEYSNSVDGSYDIAYDALNKIDKGHLCTSRYKDAVQLRKRFLRTANIIAHKYDKITQDGTLLYGVISSSNQSYIDMINKFLININVPLDMYTIVKNEIHIAVWILEDIIYELKNIINDDVKIDIIEKYPFENGIIVEKIPL